MIRTGFLVCLFAAVNASAQVELQRPYSSTASHFYYRALNFKTPLNQSRIDFYFQVPYSQLHFLKTGNDFTAAYTLTVRLTDDNDNASFEKSWDERAVSNSFEETNSADILSSSQREFIVSPGNYDLVVTMAEAEAEGSVRQDSRIVARDFTSGSLSISDIMLLTASSSVGGKHTIVPNIPGNVISRSDSFPVFYEIYTDKPGDSIYAVTEITGNKKEDLYSHSVWIGSSDSVTKVFDNIPKHLLAMGDYRLTVTLRSGEDPDAAPIAVSTTSFSIRFPDLPPTVTDLDNAADQMMYITAASTIDSIKSAPNDAAKEKRFLAFWDNYHSRFSFSGRASMAEYFNRVSYANHNFTHFFAGWKSDRGMVYILFGPPDNVDRHPFNIDTKPYEVWYYYQKDRKFTFLDNTGFGDYRLLNPIWDNNSPLSGMDFTRR